MLGDPRWQPAVSVALILEYEAVARRGAARLGLADWVVESIVDMFSRVGLQHGIRPTTFGISADLRRTEFAAREQISLEELVSDALSEKFAGAEYLRRRAARASAESFRAALDQIPDTEPEPWDRLP